MKRDFTLFLKDILESINLIENSTKSLSFIEFEKNRDIQDATIRRIEIIGEAVKNLPEELKKKYPQIKWKEIAGTRDIITHAYFGINIQAVWKVVKEDLPILKKQIQEIKRGMND